MNTKSKSVEKPKTGNTTVPQVDPLSFIRGVDPRKRISVDVSGKRVHSNVSVSKTPNLTPIETLGNKSDGVYILTRFKISLKFLLTTYQEREFWTLDPSSTVYDFTGILFHLLESTVYPQVFSFSTQ